jgi:hypothetical protein
MTSSSSLNSWFSELFSYMTIAVGLCRHEKTMITLFEDLYFKKIKDVKNLRLSSNWCCLGNLGGLTSSSSCKGADGLLTHISWNHWFCCTRRACRLPCVTLRCRNTFVISLASMFIASGDSSNLGGMKRGLHVGLKKLGSFHAASWVAARWAWIIDDSISDIHAGFSIAIDSGQRAYFFILWQCHTWYFMPKPCTHRMHDPGSIVPHIWPKVFIDNQMSRIKYNCYTRWLSMEWNNGRLHNSTRTAIGATRNLELLIEEFQSIFSLWAAGLSSRGK